MLGLNPVLAFILSREAKGIRPGIKPFKTRLWSGLLPLSVKKLRPDAMRFNNDVCPALLNS
jgi:hypothetical protein